MVDFNQCGLHLLARITLLASLISFNFIVILAKKVDNKLVQDVVHSKMMEQFGKLHDSRIEVDYGESLNRKLQQNEDSFSRMRIYFETTTIKKQIAESSVPNAEARGKLLIDTILPTVGDKWSEALSVIPAESILFTDSDVCTVKFTVPNEWINGGAPDVDLIIFVGAHEEIDGKTICGAGLGVLAFASMCALDQKDRPVVGFINVCLDAIAVRDDGSTIASAIKYTEDIVLHEVGHALGLTSEFITYFRNAETNEPLVTDKLEYGTRRCVDGYKKDIKGAPPTDVLQYGEGHGTRYYEVVTPTVRQVARNQFACQNVTGLRLENQPNLNICFGNHFDERFFLNDLMSAFYDPSAGYFSPMTLAFLEDSGHYRANYNTAQNSPFGLGAGCGFAIDKCIVNDSVPDYGKGFFCDDVSNHDFDNARWQCDATHQYRGHCDLYSLEQPPKVSYFKDKNLGPKEFQSADYCPIVINKNLPYCSARKGLTQVSEYEVFGSGSRCIDFIMNGKNSAMCLKASCNEDKRSFDFYLGEDMYSCEEDFQEFRTTSVTIQCPRLTAVCPDMFCPSMCSGKGICDWSLPVPICKCFDTKDTTSNCNGSFVVSGGRSSTNRSKIGLTLSILQLISLATQLY